MDPLSTAVIALQALKKAEAGCSRCSLYLHATQVVPGDGPADAHLMFVGEQPGDADVVVGGGVVGVTSAYWLSNEWVRVSLNVQGDRLTVRVFRTDTAQYLTADGVWQSAPAAAIDLRDKLITAAGRVGVARPPKSSGTLVFDNFQSSTNTSASLPNDLYEQHFSGNLVRGLPAGWALICSLSSLDDSDSAFCDASSALRVSPAW